MTSVEATIVWIYVILIAIWPIRLLVLELILRGNRYLTPQSPTYQGSVTPLVSVILPAKDEQTYLADCLTALSRQSYANLEIIIIDDRSSDETPQIAARFAAEDRRANVITIKELPTGWTGKTHAIHVASRQATGEWLWFIDADTLHAVDSLSVLMEHARSQNAAMVSILPELRCETFWEQVVQPIGGIVLMQSFPLGRVNNDRSPLAFANGQCILIERKAYDAAGGHSGVRSRFVEDIGLARQVKNLGYRIRVMLVRGLVTCRMYASLTQLIHGWSRILYDALDRSFPRLLFRLLDPVIFCQTGHVALLAGLVLSPFPAFRPFAPILLGLSIFHHALMYLVFRRIYQTAVPGSRYVHWFPLGNLIIDRVLIRALKMSITGKVIWRGTAYGSTSAEKTAR
jgi:glycosyltransferase involved in cell wall biosynthesis